MYINKFPNTLQAQNPYKAEIIIFEVYLLATKSIQKYYNNITSKEFLKHSCTITWGYDSLLSSIISYPEFFVMPLPEAVNRLMQRPEIPWRVLKKEALMCTQLAEDLRLYTMLGKMRAVWFHVPNEGKKSLLMHKILRGMGLIKGATDYVFLWDSGAGAIEMKTKSGRYETEQKDFAVWCECKGVRHRLCRSVEEAEETLREWGVLMG